VGWYAAAPEKERDFVRRYLARSGEDIAWDLLRVVWSSVANMVLAPMQDLLSLGFVGADELPRPAERQLGWRMPVGALNEALRLRLREMNSCMGACRKTKK